jgi:hypothetical protein
VNTTSKRLVALLACVALVGAGCSGSSGPDPVGTLTPLSGTVEILRGDAWEVITDPLELAPGDQVRSDEDGAARLQVSDAGSIEIGPSSRVRLKSNGSELMQGAALAQGSGFELSLGRTTISPMGTAAYRVDRGLSTTVGVYRGVAEISALGNPVQVDALWQAVIVANAVPTDPSPLVVSPTDAWDQLMLKDAIDVGLRLRRIEVGVRGQLDRRARAAQLVAEAMPDPLAPRRVRSLIREHSAGPGTVFVALALASQSASPTGVLRTANTILHRLELGASWIVVVAALDVARPNLLTAIARILAAIPGLIDPDAIVNGSPTTDSGGGPSPNDPSPPGGCTGDDCSPGPDPSPSGCPEGDDACAAQEAVNQVVEDITGGLGRTEPEPSPTPSLPPPLIEV